jgi:hypothetical protein
VIRASGVRACLADASYSCKSALRDHYWPFFSTERFAVKSSPEQIECPLRAAYWFTIMYKWKMRDYEELVPKAPLEPSEKTNESFIFEPILDLANTEYYRSFMNIDTEISTRKEHERTRLQVLLNKKDALKQRILDQYKKYAMIDRVFSDEIQHAETVSYFFSWGFCRRKRKREREIEPILRDFLENYDM